MKSLRWRLFVAVTGITLFFVLMSGLLNTFFLAKYYRAQKENTLKKISQEINSQYQGSPESITDYLHDLERTSGLRVVIFDAQFQTKYDSVDRGPSQNSTSAQLEPPLMPADRPAAPPLPPRGDFKGHVFAQELIVPQASRLMQGEITMAVIRDPGLKNGNFLNCARKLNNGDYLVVSTPLAAIKESSEVANRFFLFTGLLTIVVGMIAALWLAEKFTRPIRQLNEVAMEMAQLRFDTRCSIDSNDEIGQLASSINSLSEQLDYAITELRETNQKLKQDVERERKIDLMRKEFISNVSHEMKTPIALIEGYAEGLKLNVVQDDNIKNEYCDIITDETFKMNRLINSLLELSKLESGYFQLERTQFDLNSLISQYLLKLRPLFEQKGAALLWNPSGILLVDADEFYIEQVLANFISNALRHVDEQGIIRVAAEPCGDKVMVTVVNTGPMIAEEELEKIWMPFYKVDKSHSRSEGGTGLGLSIVKAIQELHDNYYGVENTSEGVKFWFSLDRA